MKLTTKLLLGATVVAGLSMSTFAACATDVYMGNKQLKNVANGVDDGDAVNLGQLNATQTFDMVHEGNRTSGTFRVTLFENGVTCVKISALGNISGATFADQTRIGTLPTSVNETNGDLQIASMLSSGSIQQHWISIGSDGAVKARNLAGSSWAPNIYAYTDVCYYRK